VNLEIMKINLALISVSFCIDLIYLILLTMFYYLHLNFHNPMTIHEYFEYDLVNLDGMIDLFYFLLLLNIPLILLLLSIVRKIPKFIAFKFYKYLEFSFFTIYFIFFGNDSIQYRKWSLFYLFTYSEFFYYAGSFVSLILISIISFRFLRRILIDEN